LAKCGNLFYKFFSLYESLIGVAASNLAMLGNKTGGDNGRRFRILAVAAFILSTQLCTGVFADDYTRTDGDATFVFTDNGNGRVFHEEIKGNQKFAVRREVNGRAYSDVYIRGRQIYSVPDIYTSVGFGNFCPGEADSYRFFLSADHRRLLVMRQFLRIDNIAYLYGMDDGHMRLVKPYHGRLDSAATDQFAGTKRLDIQHFNAGYTQFSLDPWLPKSNKIRYDMGKSGPRVTRSLNLGMGCWTFTP
jgi:hypothetical protein